MWATAWIGGFPVYASSSLINSTVTFIYTCLGRQIYGASISYLLLLMLSPKPEENIPWYRPTKYMRGYLSWKIWLPLANLTYAFYLFHDTPAMMITSPIALKLNLGDRKLPSTDPEVLKVAECNEDGVGFSPKGIAGIYFTNAALAMVITILWCILVFVFIEKQGINARSAFKSKWQKGAVAESAVKIQDVEKKGYSAMVPGDQNVTQHT